MADARVGRRYAQALFSTARRIDAVRPVEDDLNAIAGLLENDPKFRQFFLAPYTSREEKTRIAERLFSDRVTALTMQVLRIMIEKGREEDVPAVQQAYAELRRTHENVLLVKVTSAIEMDAAQRQSLLANLRTRFGKEVEGTFEVDPRVLGGVKVAYESNVLDGTVRGALNHLRDRLHHDLLKQA